MDKEQATQFILTRLQAGYDADDISEELSHILKAPSDVVTRFVDQVAARHPEELPSNATEVPEPPVENLLPSSPPTHNLNELPPGLQALLNEEISSVKTVEPVPTPGSQPSTVPPPQANIEADIPIQSTNISKEDATSNIDLEALSESVLNQLKKQRRQNDIIESVCHQTGWHWNQAQRFVARVKTQNHGQLQARQSKITALVGIGIIFVGLVMTLNGASILSDYVKLGILARENPEVLLNISTYSIAIGIGLTVTGIGMIIGGGYGIGRALTNR
jgi:hypothetical protein